MRRIVGLAGGSAACLALAAGSAPALAQERPLSVVYGPQASSAEGDSDYHELVFLSVPADLQDRLYLRVFDPDTGGDHDLVYGDSEDTEVRFAVIGGEGALSAVSSVPPSAEELASGQAIREVSVAANAALDGKWQTIASFLPDQGELVGDRRVFRLVVEGMTGNDANLYGATLSLRDRRNLAPDGLEIFAFAPTVRMPDDESVTEMRFTVPADAERLVVHNFDVANGEVALHTAFRTVPLAASGQDEWRESAVDILARERGQPAAITFAGGEEIPNDATFYVTDEAGAPLPLELPVRAWRPNARPAPVANVELLANCFSVAFDASNSSDPDGDRLSYAWDFGDGQSASGRVVVHQYPGPGTYAAELQVLDSSGQVGNGATQGFDVMVKRPPAAAAGDDIVVAPGQPVAFDGSGSLQGERPIARHLWDFYDGSQGTGASAEHVFAGPGRYIVTLTVEDDSSPPCNFDTDERIVQVNAAPVAEAGDRQRTAVGQQITLDGNRSYDVDGEIVDFAWDLADGTTKSGPVIQHVFAQPGTYDVRLTVRDDAGVANSASSDTVRIVVNAPPVAEAGHDRSLAIGEVTAFDAVATTDADGAIVDYRWEFGDGARGTGPRVDYAYPRSGTYRVTLTVRDDSATATNLDTDGLTVVVNEPPVAEAGPDQIVTTSEVTLRRQRLERRGRRHRPLRLGLRRRRRRHRADADPRLQRVGRLPGHADRDRRFRHHPQQRQRQPARRGQRGADRRCRAGPGRRAGPGADLHGHGLDRPRRRRGRVSVGLQGRQQRLRRAGLPQLRAARDLQRAPAGARRHRAQQRLGLRRGQGRDQRAAGGEGWRGRSRRPRRCGDLRCRQLVRHRRQHHVVALGLQRRSIVAARPRVGARLCVSGRLHGPADRDRRQRRAQRDRPGRGRDPDQPRAGRLRRTRHRERQHHGELRRLDLGRCRRRRADLPLGFRRRHAASRRPAGHPHLRDRRRLSGHADRRRRHGPVERDRERCDHGGDQPAAGRGRGRQPGRLRGRHRRVRRQRLLRSRWRPAAL